jgi:hypothetical protein
VAKKKMSPDRSDDQTTTAGRELQWVTDDQATAIPRHGSTHFPLAVSGVAAGYDAQPQRQPADFASGIDSPLLLAHLSSSTKKKIKKKKSTDPQ